MVNVIKLMAGVIGLGVIMGVGLVITMYYIVEGITTYRKMRGK
jgi:hypothetical protein